MEGSPAYPSVDEARQLVEERIGREHACPCCGTSGWKAANDLLLVPAIWAHDHESDTGREGGLEGWTTLPMLVFVCEQCGAVIPFADEDLERAIDAVSDASAFRVLSHEVVLRGECGGCSSAKPRQAA